MLVSKCPDCGYICQYWVVDEGDIDSSEVCYHCESNSLFNSELDYIDESEITDPKIFLDYITNVLTNANEHKQAKIARALYKKMCELVGGATNNSIPIKLAIAKIIKDTFYEAT